MCIQNRALQEQLKLHINELTDNLNDAFLLLDINAQ